MIPKMFLLSRSLRNLGGLLALANFHLQNIFLNGEIIDHFTVDGLLSTLAKYVISDNDMKIIMQGCERIQDESKKKRYLISEILKNTEHWQLTVVSGLLSTLEALKHECDSMEDRESKKKRFLISEIKKEEKQRRDQEDHSTPEGVMGLTRSNINEEVAREKSSKDKSLLSRCCSRRNKSTDLRPVSVRIPIETIITMRLMSRSKQFFEEHLPELKSLEQQKKWVHYQNLSKGAQISQSDDQAKLFEKYLFFVVLEGAEVKLSKYDQAESDPSKLRRSSQVVRLVSRWSDSEVREERENMWYTEKYSFKYDLDDSKCSASGDFNQNKVLDIMYHHPITEAKNLKSIILDTKVPFILTINQINRMFNAEDIDNLERTRKRKFEELSD